MAARASVTALHGSATLSPRHGAGFLNTLAKDTLRAAAPFRPLHYSKRPIAARPISCKADGDGVGSANSSMKNDTMLPLKQGALVLLALSAFGVLSGQPKVEALTSAEIMRKEVEERIEAMRTASTSLETPERAEMVGSPQLAFVQGPSGEGAEEQFEAIDAPALVNNVTVAAENMMDAARSLFVQAVDNVAARASAFDASLPSLSASQVGDASQVSDSTEGEALAEEVESVGLTLGGVGWLGSLAFGSAWYFGRKGKDDLVEDLKEANAEVKRQQEYLALLQDEIEELRWTMRQKESEVAATSSREKLELSNQLLLEKQVFAEMKKNLAVEKLAVENLAKRVEELQASVRDGEQKQRALGESLAESGEKLKVLGDKLANTSKTLEEKQAEAANTRDKLEIQSQQLKVSEDQRAKLEEELKIKAAAYAEKEAAAQSLGGQLAKAVEEAKQTDEYLADLRTELISLAQALKEERSNSKKLQTRLGETSEELEVKTLEISGLKGQLSMSTELAEQLESRLMGLRNNIEEVKAELNQERQVAVAAKAQLEQSQAALAEEKQIVDGLRVGVSQATQALDAMAREVQMLTDQSKASEALVSSQGKEIAALGDAVAQGKHRIGDLEQQKQQLEATIAQAEEEKAAALSRVASIGSELREQEQKMGILKGQVTELSRLLELANTQLKDIAEVRAEAALMVEHFEDVAAAEKEAKHGLEEKYAALEKESRIAKTMMSDLATELSKAQQELSDAKNAREEAEQALAAAQQQQQTSGPRAIATQTPAPMPAAPRRTSNIPSKAAAGFGKKPEPPRTKKAAPPSPSSSLSSMQQQQAPAPSVAVQGVMKEAAVAAPGAPKSEN